MEKYMLCGIDAHDKTLVCAWAENKQKPKTKTFANNAQGHQQLVAQLRKDKLNSGSMEICLAYEASSLGFGLYDTFTDLGLSCHVLAPHKMRHSSEDKKKKNDIRDALKVLEELRNHYLAGNDLPDVWIPDQQTRCDRQLVRTRLDLSHEITRIKTKIRTFIKVNGLKVEYQTKHPWTVNYRKGLVKLQSQTDVSLSTVLAVLFNRLEELEAHQDTLDEAIKTLSQTERYRNSVEALVSKTYGVQIFSAMVFLTELGNLSRFTNRRQIAAFLGLAPCSFESGEISDRKGHITRQGTPRVRKVLCQSVLSQIRQKRGEVGAYDRIVVKNPKKKKIAVVACMRRLAIRMWHTALDAQALDDNLQKKAA